MKPIDQDEENWPTTTNVQNSTAKTARPGPKNGQALLHLVTNGFAGNASLSTTRYGPPIATGAVPSIGVFADNGVSRTTSNGGVTGGSGSITADDARTKRAGTTEDRNSENGIDPPIGFSVIGGSGIDTRIACEIGVSD